MVRSRFLKRRAFITSSLAGVAGLAATRFTSVAGISMESLAGAGWQGPTATRKILIAGGNFHTAFIRYMAELTGKPRPKICYLPTASADAPAGRRFPLFTDSGSSKAATRRTTTRKRDDGRSIRS